MGSFNERDSRRAPLTRPTSLRFATSPRKRGEVIDSQSFDPTRNHHALVSADDRS